MKNYVVSFIFTPDTNDVWLIEKQKPEWQKGCLNGIGGKIEIDELPIDAAIRELKEEAGVDNINLIEIGYMFGKNIDKSDFKVYIFTGITDKELKSMESEQIYLINTSDIKNYNHIENIPMLIETCLFKLNYNTNFKNIIMEY